VSSDEFKSKNFDRQISHSNLKQLLVNNPKSRSLIILDEIFDKFEKAEARGVKAQTDASTKD
jgi:hypothetical protein